MIEFKTTYKNKIIKKIQMISVNSVWPQHRQISVIFFIKINSVTKMGHKSRVNHTLILMRITLRL